jgi:hypothetical protein
MTLSPLREGVDARVKPAHDGCLFGAASAPYLVTPGPFYTVITGLDPVIQGTKPAAKS